MKLTVDEMMVTDVISVTPDMKLSDVANLMIRHLISGMPILDNLGRVVSIIGEGDTLRLAAEFGLDCRISHCLDRLPRKEQLITLSKSHQFTDAYALFLKHKFHRIPVVDSSGAIKGIVTRSVIMRLFVEAQIGKKIPARRPA